MTEQEKAEQTKAEAKAKAEQTKAEAKAKAEAKVEAEAKVSKNYKKPPESNLIHQKDERAPDNFSEVHFHYVGNSESFKGKTLTAIVSPAIADLYKAKMKKASANQVHCPIRKVV